MKNSAAPAQMFEMRQEYDELISATQTSEAQAVMRAEGFSSGKQLLLAALFTYLKREAYLSPEEEERGLSSNGTEIGIQLLMSLPANDERTCVRR